MMLRPTVLGVHTLMYTLSVAALKALELSIALVSYAIFLPVVRSVRQVLTAVMASRRQSCSCFDELEKCKEWPSALMLRVPTRRSMSMSSLGSLSMIWRKMSFRMLRTSAHVQPQTAAMADGLKATVAFESLDLKGEML